MTVPSVNWNYPTAIKAGPGRIKELPDWCRELGMARPCWSPIPARPRCP